MYIKNGPAMNTTIRATLDDLFLWYVYGVGTSQTHWGNFRAGDGFYSSQWLTIADRPISEPSKVPLIELSSQGSYVDPRDADAVTFDLNGSHLIAIRDVEYVDSSLATNTTLLLASHFGFTTDGSLNAISANIGNHEMVFTTAIKDSSLMLGKGWDVVTLSDQLDIPGTQYWSLIRRADNALDAYSLLTGLRVRMEDGAESRNGQAGYRNFGEVEQVFLADSRHPTSPNVLYNPGGVDLPTGGDRGLYENIDLRSDGQAFSDSFNLAYFNFIRYTSDNVWAAESTIHDGVKYSSPSDGTVTVAKNGYDAPILTGQLSVLGQSRNGSHDLIVAEQAAGQAIDGKFRLYSFDVDSGLYNEFNAVYLGTAASEVSNKSTIVGTAWSDRVALYGFGGEDVLIGGAGRDYIFGGESVYNQLISGENGNQVTGGLGADYFGVGNTNSSGVVTGTNSTIGAVGTTGAFHQGYATDVIMDWEAQDDSLVVLSNGVAVIAGLRSGISVMNLSGSDTIDLRDYAARATSDQDFDGARGGDGWDSSQSLNYIYANQGQRDANSIANEADRTVVNAGLIVARGLAGSDTVFGSAGNDYLYGNESSNLIVLSEGGSDRVYYDTFDSSLARQYVADFSTVDDQFFVNKRVIDAFGGTTSRALTAVDVSGAYVQAVKYNPSVNFLHDVFYAPSILDTNANHDAQDGSAPSFISGSDGTTFGIGVGMMAAGYVLLAIPFGQFAGYALIASGLVLGAGSTFVNTQEHRNATFSGDVSNYLNVISSNTLQAAGNTVVATDVSKSDSNVRFLDFFGSSNAGDGFVPVVEFTSNPGQGIYGYFALHSNTETFVFLVASRDNLVENGEAIKVAEINGLLTADDFKVYDGQADIYNARTEAAVVLVDPRITSVKDGSSDEAFAGATPDRLIDDVQNPVSITVNITGAVAAGSYLKVYDKTTLIYDGSAGSPVNSNVSVSLLGSIYTVTDSRSLGTVARQTDSRDLTLDNDFVLHETVVNYSVEFVDGTTGIPTRDGSGAITITGGNATIDGGTGSDTLNITGTSDYLNNAADAQVVRIETIYMTAEDTNKDGVITGADSSVFLDLSKQTDGFVVYGTTLADSIIGSQGNDNIVGLNGVDTINLASGGADQIAYAYSANLGVDDQYDIITGMSGNDVVSVGAPTWIDTNNDTVVDTLLPGFADRDGDPTRLLYEDATIGSNIAVASGTELLVVTNSNVSATGDLTYNIARALESAFNLSGLDGNSPNASTGAGSNSSLIYAVRSDTGSYWVGRYEDVGNDDFISDATEIEVFANADAAGLNNFWLPTRLAPQALSINLPSDAGRLEASGTLYTSNTSFSVSGLQSGNSVYYSLNGGANWSTASADQTSIALNVGANDIRVRQVDGLNYSPETSSGARIVDVSTGAGPYYDSAQGGLQSIGGVTFVGPGSYGTNSNSGLFSGVNYYENVPGHTYFFDFDNALGTAQGDITFSGLTVKVNTSGNTPSWVNLTEWDGTGSAPATYYYLNPNSASSVPGAILLDVGSAAADTGSGADLQISISGTVSDAYISNVFSINHYIDVL